MKPDNVIIMPKTTKNGSCLRNLSLTPNNNPPKTMSKNPITFVSLSVFSLFNLFTFNSLG